MEGVAASAPLVSIDALASSADARDRVVIEHAAALFLERGIADVKMTDIAEAAGMGVATLYRHHSTKTNLVILVGTYLWSVINERIRALVESDEFLALDGHSRLSALLEEYCQTYAAHSDFVRFVDEFDHLALVEHVSPAELAEYGAEVDSFYVMFEDAYLLGRQDGSITREVDFPVFYRSVAHALMGIAEKLERGEIIPSDDFSNGIEELGYVIKMAQALLAPQSL